MTFEGEVSHGHEPSASSKSSETGHLTWARTQFAVNQEPRGQDHFLEQLVSGSIKKALK